MRLTLVTTSMESTPLQQPTSKRSSGSRLARPLLGLAVIASVGWSQTSSAGQLGLNSPLMDLADVLAPQSPAFKIIGDMTLEGITSTELVGGSAVQDGTWPSSKSAGQGPGLGISMIVSRSVSSLWRMALPEQDRGSLEVSYEIVGANGAAGCLSHVVEPEAEIWVTVRPLQPTVLSSDGQTALLEGGDDLDLDLARARSAGTYAGTLRVTINRF